MSKMYCNPLNIRYPYQFIDFAGELSVNREGADPSLIEWKGIYYLFVSMTTGFWYSQDLLKWNFRKLEGDVIYDYAPDVRIVDNYMYLTASRNSENVPIYRSKDPINESFEKLTDLFTYWDPNLFQDDDHRTYFYWGCSNKHPIWGIEMDTISMKPIGGKVDLIFGHADEHGFERRGNDHRYVPKSEREKLMAQYIGTEPFIEGAWMNKMDGTYYLQYAAPATQNNIYGDGVYKGKSPLGPFTYAKNNPFSYKPGGFIPGAGHGSTMQDKDGNWWHTSTMVISVNHMFERRIGLFPAGFDTEGELFCNTSYGDWPIEIKRKMNAWEDPKWMLLSYNKNTTSSSYEENHQPGQSVDENVKTCWTAKSNGLNEWLVVDLESICTVNAIQINFADHDIPFKLPLGKSLQGNQHTKRYIDLNDEYTRYLLEGSIDGEQYVVISDKRKVTTDLSHDFIALEQGEKYRFIRISHITVPYKMNPSISGLRVFGSGNVPMPKSISTFNVEIEGPLDIIVKWKQTQCALGYSVFFGYHPEKMYHSYMVFDSDEVPIRALNKGQDLYIRIDTFNEKGITKGVIKKVI